MSAASTAAGHRLFRPEALEAQRQALLGRILINTPLAHWLVAATAAALVAALFAFLWFAHYTPRIHAHGVLIAAASPASHGARRATARPGRRHRRRAARSARAPAL